MERVATAIYRAAVVLLLALVAYQQFEMRQEAATAEDNARGAAFLHPAPSAPDVQKVEVVNSAPLPVQVAQGQGFTGTAVKIEPFP